MIAGFLISKTGVISPAAGPHVTGQGDTTQVPVTESMLALSTELLVFFFFCIYKLGFILPPSLSSAWLYNI